MNREGGWCSGVDVVNGTFDTDGGGATMVSALLWSSSCADLLEVLTFWKCSQTAHPSGE